MAMASPNHATNSRRIAAVYGYGTPHGILSLALRPTPWPMRHDKRLCSAGSTINLTVLSPFFATAEHASAAMERSVVERILYNSDPSLPRGQDTSFHSGCNMRQDSRLYDDAASTAAV
jgi:hypothetical protein